MTLVDKAAHPKSIAAQQPLNAASCGELTPKRLDGAFWRDVAILIADARRNGGKLALGDAFGIALARRLDADFITADRHEIEALHNAGVCRAVFIR